MPRPDLKPRDARDRLIVALDYPSVIEARRLVAELGERGRFYKIGMQLVFAGGLTLVEELLAADKRVFLDMKLLDIDQTVAGGVDSIARLGVTLTTIHGYPKAMRAAVASLNSVKEKSAKASKLGLLAVTALTSMSDADLKAAGYVEDAATLVGRRAEEALSEGMDGIVCSPKEAEAVRGVVGPDMLIVTPGIRPAGDDLGDQKRTLSPAEAIQAGADYLVVGRPVTAAREPAAAANEILAGIEKAA